MDSQSVDTIAVPEVVETPVAAPEMSSNWLDSIKERFSGQEPWAVELVVFGLGGFVAGFLLKNFGKLLLLLLAAALIVVLALHYTHVNEMPFEQLQALLGISSFQNVQDIITVKIAFCKEHPVALVSGVVGMMVGWKVG
jgi:uncharacterized membrane protein (Fun14 family)